MTPTTRREFWQEKFEANRNRDKRNCEALAVIGWRVLVVWECAIKTRKGPAPDELAAIVADWLASSERYDEIGESRVA